MPNIVRTTAKYNGKCCSCGERWRKFEAFINVEGRRGENYCVHCLETAKRNNPPRIGDIVHVEGDNRVFVMTKNGPRAGVENTGHRCEDAPCCGCC